MRTLSKHLLGAGALLLALPQAVAELNMLAAAPRVVKLPDTFVMPTAAKDNEGGVSPAITPAPMNRYEMLRRQAETDSGFDDPLQCNTGFCQSTESCTVFKTVGQVMGVCCPTTLTCTPQTACVPHSSVESLSLSFTLSAPVIISGTLFCDSSRPHCIAVQVDFGYKTDALFVTNCWSESLGTTTTLNPSYRLYSPTPTTSTGPTDTATDDISETSSPADDGQDGKDDDKPVEEEKKGLSTGAIAGIAVGSVALVCIAACIIAFLLIRRRRANHDTSPPPTIPPNGYDNNPAMMQQNYAPQYQAVPQAASPPDYGNPQAPYNAAAYGHYQPTKPQEYSPTAYAATTPTSPGLNPNYGQGYSGSTPVGNSGSDNRTSMVSELPGSTPQGHGQYPQQQQQQQQQGYM